NRLVTSTINQNQFDALVSFSYNIGLGSLKSSTLLKRVNNNPQDADICNQFSRWNKAGGKVLLGLTRRRKEEAELYFKEVFNQADNCLINYKNEYSKNSKKKPKHNISSNYYGCYERLEFSKRKR